MYRDMPSKHIRVFGLMVVYYFLNKKELCSVITFRGQVQSRMEAGKCRLHIRLMPLTVCNSEYTCVFKCYTCSQTGSYLCVDFKVSFQILTHDPAKKSSSYARLKEEVSFFHADKAAYLPF